MEAEEPIDHIAVVRTLLPERRAEVVISGAEGCEGCAAAKLCHSTGGDGETVLDAALAPGLDVKPGDRVIVRGSERIHRKAIMLATVIPCLALIAVLVIVYLLTLNQGIAALAGLGSMVVFFLLLYIFRDRLATEFSFTVTGHAASDSTATGDDASAATSPKDSSDSKP